MKMLTIQVATLIACAIGVCTAGEDNLEKKCLPESAKLKYLEFDLLEEYEDFIDNWRIEMCTSSVFCDGLTCMQLTYGLNKNGIVYQLSAYNESSQKFYESHGLFAQSEAGGLQLKSSDKRANGEFHLLELKDTFYFLVACFENKFAAWVASKGVKLEESDKMKAKKIAEKNGLKWDDFRQLPNEDCEKKKSGYR